MPRLVRDVVSFATGLVSVLLVFRLSLRLVNANTAAPFVQWIYTASAPLVAPFQAALPAPVAGVGFVLEFSTLLAIVVYAVVGLVIQQLIDALDR